MNNKSLFAPKPINAEAFRRYLDEHTGARVSVEKLAEALIASLAKARVKQ